MKKLLLGLGSLGAIAAPIAAVVSCAPWDKPKTGGADLTGAKKAIWHGMFHVSGRSTPAAGTMYSVKVGGKSISYTWTAADTASSEMTGYKAGSAPQKIAIDYLAGRFAAENTGTSAAAVKTAFGIPTTQHSIGA